MAAGPEHRLWTPESLSCPWHRTQTHDSWPLTLTCDIYPKHYHWPNLWSLTLICDLWPLDPNQQSLTLWSRPDAWPLTCPCLLPDMWLLTFGLMLQPLTFNPKPWPLDLIVCIWPLTQIWTFDPPTTLTFDLIHAPRQWIFNPDSWPLTYWAQLWSFTPNPLIFVPNLRP